MSELDTVSTLRLDPSTPACPRHACMRWVTVEPALILTVVSVGLHIPLSTQYLWERFSQDRGYNLTKVSNCTDRSSDPQHKEVEVMTAKWDFYISMVGFSIGLLVMPLLGSWSDAVGRKPIMIISNMGMALQTVVYLLVMYLKLPVAYFIVGRIVCGLGGEISMLVATCFSYMADISDSSCRTFRVAVLESCLGISMILSGIIGGEWKAAHGTIQPYWFILGCNLASVVYIYWCVPETVLPDPSARFFSFRNYASIWRFMSTGVGGSGCVEGSFQRRRLWLYTLCFSIVTSVYVSSSNLLVLYELSPPLCWGPVLIGLGSTTQSLADVTSLLGLKLMQYCLEEYNIILVGLASQIVGLLIFSLADNTALMFTGYAASLLSGTSISVLLSKMSQLVDPSQQGILFASINFIKILSSLVVESAFNSLYIATLHFMKGLAFMCSAVVLLIPMGVIGYVQCLEWGREK